MSYPADYDPRPLAPTIQIFSGKWRHKFTWTHPILDDNPTQDFTLLEWRLSGGLNSSAGFARLIIEDTQNQMTDGTERASSSIKTGDIVQILLGKDSGNLTVWFTGVVNEPAVQRPGFGQQRIIVPCYGYSSTLATRFVSIDHKQNKVADVLDDNDNSAKISEIVRRILTDDEVLLLPPRDRNISLDIQDIDIKLAEFRKINRSQGICIAELANVVNGVYGINPDLNFFFHDSRQSSGFTLTNDLEKSYDYEKLMIFRNKVYNYTDSSIRKAFTSLIGLDTTRTKNQLEDITTNTTRNLHQSSFDWFAFEIPFKGPIENMEIFLKRNSYYSSGGLSWKIFHEIQGDSVDGKESGIVNGTIPQETLQNVSLTGSWVKLDFELEDPLERLYKRVLYFDHLTGIEVPYQSNPDPSVGRWQGTRDSTGESDESGQMRFRIVARVNTLLKAQNTTLKHTHAPKENIQQLSDVETTDTATTLYEGLMEQAGNIRRTYSQVMASTPVTRPDLGKLVKIIDKFNGLNTNALLIGYDIQSDTSQNLTAMDISLELEEWI